MNAPLSFVCYAKLLESSPSMVVREEARPGYGRAPEALPEPEVIADWRQVHARVLELAAERAGHERELCRWLLAAERLGVHTRAGCASIREYADQVIGLRGRQAEERLRVGRALATLPLLDEALATGELSWSAVREVSRVATADTEKAWRAWAKGRRCREIEQAVAARHRGDGPEDRGDASLVKHRLRFEVRAETMALFRDAQAAVRAELGGDVDDDTLLYEIARRVLGGPHDEGRASYQVAVTQCEDCGRTSMDAGGASHPVDEVVAEMAACDAQHLGRVGGPQPRRHEGAPAAELDARPRSTRPASSTASPHRGASTSEGETARSTRSAVSTPNPHVGAPAPSRQDARHSPRAASAGPHAGTPTTTPTREGAKHSPRAAGAGPHVGAASSRRARATQTIPPAVRREVRRRDRRRCVVPGCQNHIFLDVHHLDPRAEGGDHHPDRLATLCGSHHRSVHLGHLCIDGAATEGFSFRHGDGTPYGQAWSPLRLDLASLALGALENMGFKPTQARKLVDAVLASDAVPDTPEDFIRAALRATS